MSMVGATYEATECPAELKAGRIGGAFGGSASKQVTQQCVKVTAEITNPAKQTLKDVAVFGFVLDEQVRAFELCAESPAPHAPHALSARRGAPITPRTR